MERKFPENYFVEVDPLLQVLAEKSFAKLRKINSEYLFELRLILQKYRKELIQSTESLAKNSAVRSAIHELNLQYLPLYVNANSQFEEELRRFLQDRCTYPLGAFPIKEPSGWANCQLQVLEDLMRIQMVSVLVAHALAPYIFAMLSGKSHEFYQTLLSFCHDAARAPIPVRELEGVFSNLQIDIDLLGRKDLSNYFADLLQQHRETEMVAIFNHYRETGAFAEQPCHFCRRQIPFWILISNPTQEFICTRDIPTILGYYFRFYFFIEIESFIVDLQNQLDTENFSD